MPKDAKLTTAKDQINYLANQINRTIEVKLLYNNLLEKFNEIEKRNHKYNVFGLILIHILYSSKIALTKYFSIEL
jgi:hypothetical protein